MELTWTRSGSLDTVSELTWTRSGSLDTVSGTDLD